MTAFRLLVRRLARLNAMRRAGRVDVATWARWAAWALKQYGRE